MRRAYMPILAQLGRSPYHSKSEGGSDEIENLIVLCPTCHAAFHRGTYSKEAIRVWKITLLQLNNSYDRNAVNLLLLLEKLVRCEW
jgi:predicted restriction endonuclease